MPLFRNTSSRAITFDVGREHFEVPAGKVCEIPKMHAYVVASRGLPLEPTTDASALVDSTIATSAPVRLPDGVSNRPAVSSDEEEDGDSDVEEQLSRQGARRKR